MYSRENERERGERERVREREREREREGGRERERQTDRQTDGQTDRQRQRERCEKYITRCVMNESINKLGCFHYTVRAKKIEMKNCGYIFIMIRS